MSNSIEEIKKLIKHPEINEINLSHYKEIADKHEGMYIGVLGESIKGLNSFKTGEYVLYEPYTVEDGYNRMLFVDLEKSVNFCTISKPNERYFKGESNIDRVGDTVGVPLEYIKHRIII